MISSTISTDHAYQPISTAGSRHIFLPRFAGGDPNSGCPVLWDDGERVFCRGWRIGADGKRSAVLIVLPVAAHPSRSSLDRLTHEHGLKDELDAAWALRPLELVHDDGHTMLVLDGVDGLEPLERLLGAPMEVGRFLRLAIGIATALGKVHQRGLIHKDITPANVLVNGADGQVRLTGFGIASRLSRERQSPDPPEVIAGTLAYMAPEQTGRMNRSIDSRSDLYALGVIFYRDAHRSSAVYGFRSDGMGALPHRQATGATGRAAEGGSAAPSRQSS